MEYFRIEWSEDYEDLLVLIAKACIFDEGESIYVWDEDQRDLNLEDKLKSGAITFREALEIKGASCVVELYEDDRSAYYVIR